MSVEVANESGAEVDERALADVARHVLAQMGVSSEAELSLLVVDADRMAELHVQWMDLEGPTDVMAFPMDDVHDVDDVDDVPEGLVLLGDVVLCPQVAAQQAADAGHSTDDELALLTTHGVLHLLGYDHEEPEEHAEMFGLQAELLASWRASR